MKSTAILVAVVLVALGLGCGEGQDEDEFEQAIVDLTGQPPEVAYVALNCAKCHGGDIEGQRTAPKLTSLSARWTEERLVAYLRDPKAVQAATPRLAFMAEQYPIEMPAYPHTDEAVLRGLTGWLLAQ
jgi:cytochrome c553